MPERFSFETLLPLDSALGMPAGPEPQGSAGGMAPTLFVGLGSTGYKLVRALKRRMPANLGEDGSGACQYIVFDTRPQADHQAGSPLPPGEYVYLPPFQADKLVSSAGDSTPLDDWWPYPYAPEYKGKGTGGSRALGRLAGYKYALSFIAPRLRDKLETAWNESTAGYKAVFKIYVLSSLAGGTGSGMLVDVAYMLRHEIENGYSSRYLLTGVLVMPSTFLPTVTNQARRVRMQANGYAALLELDSLNAGTPYPAEPQPGYTLSAQTAARPPFDYTYLIGRSNEQGLTLPTLEAVCEMAAHALVLDNSPLTRNQPAEIQEPELPRRRSRGKPTAYGSLGVGALVFPLRGVAGWCALKATAPFIRDVLLNPIRGKETAEREGAALLEYLHLGHTGATETVQTLTADDRGLPFRPLMLDASTFEQVPEHDLMSALENALTMSLQGIASWLPAAETRSRTLIASVEAGIRLTIQQAVRDAERGPQFADWLLAQAAIKLNAFRAVLSSQEQQKAVKQLAQAEDNVQSARHALEQALARPAIFLGRRAAVRSAVKEFPAAANELTDARLQSDLLALTLDVYDAVMDSLANVGQEVKQLIFTLEYEAQEALKEAEYARQQWRLAQNRPRIARSLLDDPSLSSLYESVAPTGRSAYERRKLLEAFWTFVSAQDEAEQAMWELGPQATPAEPGHRAVYDFLCAHIEGLLARTSLLARLKSNDWKALVQEQYRQTAPFWSLLPSKQVKELSKRSRRIDRVGYGEDAAHSGWAAEVEQALGANVATVQTHNDQEIAFLREVHGLPLNAIREFEIDLKPAYEALQADWRSGKAKVPVHTSRLWDGGTAVPAESAVH